MGSRSEFKNIPGVTKEVRESAIATFDCLSNWKDEIETVNERCLPKVLDQTSAVARSMGWPDQVVRSTREYVENASKTQTEMIDQIMEGWKRQLRSPTAPMAISQSFAHPTTFFGAEIPQFNPIAPWTFWLQAAEMWQRTWMQNMNGRRDHSH